MHALIWFSLQYRHANLHNGVLQCHRLVACSLQLVHPFHASNDTWASFMQSKPESTSLEFAFNQYHSKVRNPRWQADKPSNPFVGKAQEPALS
ncbi:hypothetical protein CEXT_198491 [Caerostris extrusa]|uniref:Uncharacterized protein n=1 Tax=Caerostris extrusa TaxID=172846 RepID=A0AAV4XTZ1_CAEEX|nr:hypothetical protein CEXT_198491 [Caerostris extrusa]